MTNLINELRRRNMFRVAGIYAVVGWILVQVAIALETSIGLPEWFDGFVVALLLIGFPIALLLTWAFEMTPEGVKRTETSDDDEVATPGRRLDGLIIVGIAAILGLGVWQQMTKPDVVYRDANGNAIESKENDDTAREIQFDPLAPVDSKNISDASIAVLPFADLSPNSDQAYFSDGISEEILNVLVRIDSLKVASRTSAFGFKGQEALGIPVIAERLNVRHILEGSVRKSGQTVRITAQLIDAKSDMHLWSETFDRSLTTENIFAIQDEIAKAIVDQLGEMLGEESQTTDPLEVTTENLDAYELYLKANEIYHRRNARNILEMTALYEQAVALDPDFAEAWAGLAASYSHIPSWLLGSREEYLPKSRTAADRASALDDDLAQPYATRASVTSELGDMVGALDQIQQALERDPNHPHTLYAKGNILLELGFIERAEKEFQKCLESDPNYEICRRFYAITRLYQGDGERAARIFETGLDRGQYSYLGIFANYYGATGNESALKALANVMFEGAELIRDPYLSIQTDPSYSFEQYKAHIRKILLLETGEKKSDEVFILEVTQGDFPADIFWDRYNYARRNPGVLADKPNYRKNLMRERGLPAYWRAKGFPPQCRPVGTDDFECDDVKADGK